MKTLIAILFLIVGLGGAAFIAVWWGIIQPIVEIINTCRAPSGPDAWVIALAIGKFFLRDLLAVIWFACCLGLAKAFAD